MCFSPSITTRFTIDKPETIHYVINTFSLIVPILGLHRNLKIVIDHQVFFATIIFQALLDSSHFRFKAVFIHLAFSELFDCALHRNSRLSLNTISVNLFFNLFSVLIMAIFINYFFSVFALLSAKHAHLFTGCAMNHLIFETVYICRDKAFYTSIWFAPIMVIHV